MVDIDKYFETGDMPATQREWDELYKLFTDLGIDPLDEEL